jgi:Mg2+/citrate symporter
MFNKYKKVILISIITIIAVSVALYFSPTRKLNNATAEQNKKQEAQKVNQDATKTDALKKEKEVFNGQVYIQNNVVTATMIIKDGVSEADAKVLADKYAKQLKEQHKDMKVNVQAVQKGKSIADITIEK